MKPLPALALILVTATAQARPIWVLGARASSYLGGQPVRWNGNVVFHNFTQTDGTVKLVHVSNAPGGTPALPADTVPPDTSTSSFNGGAPAAAWIAQYDVSDEITPESRLEIDPLAEVAPGGQILPPLAVVQLPVWTRLYAAGEPQRHLGTDQGGTPVRINVGIYNAGTSTATATITLVERVVGLPVPVPLPNAGATAVRRAAAACQSEITRTVTIAPDTYQQFALGTLQPCYNPYSFETYTTVVVDQPSLSVVSTLADGALIAASVR